MLIRNEDLACELYDRIDDNNTVHGEELPDAEFIRARARMWIEMWADKLTFPLRLPQGLRLRHSPACGWALDSELSDDVIGAEICTYVAPGLAQALLAWHFTTNSPGMSEEEGGFLAAVLMNAYSLQWREAPSKGAAAAA